MELDEQPRYIIWSTSVETVSLGDKIRPMQLIRMQLTKRSRHKGNFVCILG